MKTATYTDKHTGKEYRVNGTSVTQYSGVPVFHGRVLHLWGDKLAVVDFKTQDVLDGWLGMMHFGIRG
ncbi:TPA: hypothetical protein KNH08_001967 [Serratia fonticola]|nr:hypothetical protein [Serratia fonticola]